MPDTAADEPVNSEKNIGGYEKLFDFGNAIIIHVKAIRNSAFNGHVSYNSHMCGFDHIVDIISYKTVNCPATAAKNGKAYNSKESFGFDYTEKPYDYGSVNANTDEKHKIG